MRYIKTYEYSKKCYNVGDYIIFNNDSRFDIKSYKNYGIIKSRFLGQKDYVEMYHYDVDYIDSNDFSIQNIKMFYVNNDEIIRLMTKNEIVDFELTHTTNKYNL